MSRAIIAKNLNKMSQVQLNYQWNLRSYSPSVHYALSQRVAPKAVLSVNTTNGLPGYGHVNIKMKKNYRRTHRFMVKLAEEMIRKGTEKTNLPKDPPKRHPLCRARDRQGRFECHFKQAYWSVSQRLVEIVFFEKETHCKMLEFRMRSERYDK